MTWCAHWTVDGLNNGVERNGFSQIRLRQSARQLSGTNVDATETARQLERKKKAIGVNAEEEEADSWCKGWIKHSEWVGPSVPRTILREEWAKVRGTDNLMGWLLPSRQQHRTFSEDRRHWLTKAATMNEAEEPLVFRTRLWVNSDPTFRGLRSSPQAECKAELTNSLFTSYSKKQKWMKSICRWLEVVIAEDNDRELVPANRSKRLESLAS